MRRDKGNESQHICKVVQCFCTLEFLASYDLRKENGNIVLISPKKSPVYTVQYDKHYYSSDCHNWDLWIKPKGCEECRQLKSV